MTYLSLNKLLGIKENNRMNKTELGRRLFAVSHIRGTFRLRSGRSSEEYFDKYLFEAQPMLLQAIAEHMAGLIPSDADVLAGLELGGIPVVTLLSSLTGIHARFVRKQAKNYGTGKLAEGGEVAAKRVVVVEDVVTSGGQIIASTTQLRALGAMVSDVLCVIDREAGGTEPLAAAGLRLHALFTMSELQSLAQLGAAGDALPRAPER